MTKMTPAELEEACNKFRDYLQANGQRPVAMILHTCEDDGGPDRIVRCGLDEVVEELCLATMAHLRGMRLTLDDA